jgi:DNA-directed RNA polymerase subunit RPC12/RpoP
MAAYSRSLKRPHTQTYVGKCFRVKQKPSKTSYDCSFHGFHKRIIDVVEADIGDVVHVIKCTCCCCLDDYFADLVMVELLNGTTQFGHIPGECIDLTDQLQYKCFLCHVDFGFNFDQASSHLIKCHMQQDYSDQLIHCPACGYKSRSVETIRKHFTKSHNGEWITGMTPQYQGQLTKSLIVDEKKIGLELKTRKLETKIGLQLKTRKLETEMEMESYKADLKMLQNANDCLLGLNNTLSLKHQQVKKQVSEKKATSEKLKVIRDAELQEVKKQLSKVQVEHVKTYQAFKEKWTKVQVKEAEIEELKATNEKLINDLKNAEPSHFEFEDHNECKCKAAKAMNDQLMKENDNLKVILEIRDQELQLRVNEIKLLKNCAEKIST